MPQQFRRGLKKIMKHALTIHVVDVDGISLMTSFIDEELSCEAIIENGTCYPITTVMNVSFYPVTFSEARVNLMLVSKSSEVLEESNVIYEAADIETVTTSITMTFVGVEAKEM